MVLVHDTLSHRIIALYKVEPSQKVVLFRTLKQNHQSKTSYKYMLWHIDEILF